MNTMTLYELSHQYQQVLEALTDPEADIPTVAIVDTLEGLAVPLQDKAVNVAKFLRNMEATAEAIKNAEETMAKRRKALENRARWLRDYLQQAMEACAIERIESPWFCLAIQQNPAAVEVYDENSLPEDFRQQVITLRIDKTAIKKAIESGQEVPGAVLKRGRRLVIR